MTSKLQTNSIASSIILTLIVAFLWGFTSPFVRWIAEPHGLLASSTLTSVINIAFALITIALLGVINQTCGFKHVFKTEGFVKGLPAILPIMAFAALKLVFASSNEVYVSSENFRAFPALAFIRLTSVLMETVLFRGLLVTALFIKASRTEGERIRSVFKAAAWFWVIYTILNVLTTGHLDLMALINTFVMSAGFCAAYMYSKNLMIPAFGYAIWSVFGVWIDSSVVNNYIQPTPLSVVAVVGVLVFILVFAVRFSLRAEVFCLDRSNPPPLTNRRNYDRN